MEAEKCLYQKDKYFYDYFTDCGYYPTIQSRKEYGNICPYCGKQIEWDYDDSNIC